MSTHTRCRKCDARKALARWPTEATCACGGTYRIDKWANSKPWRKKMCRCNGVAKWSGSSFADSPHRLGSPGCVGHVEPLPPSEYDPEFGF